MTKQQPVFRYRQFVHEEIKNNLLLPPQIKYETPNINRKAAHILEKVFKVSS